MSLGGRERWRKPLIPVDYWTDTEHVLIRPDGTITPLEVFAYSPSDMQRMRQGYACAHCHNPLEHPFPKVCPIGWCKFPVRDRQSEYLSKMYRGNVQDNHSAYTRSDAEIIAMERYREERRLEELGLLPHRSILVPKSISAA